MTYLQLAYVHLATILPAMALGTGLLFLKKGTGGHRLAGRAYMALMAATSLITLAMPARVGPRIAGPFGFIHILSAVTLVAVAVAWRAARRRDIRLHRRIMVRLYIGAFVLAGGFTLMPGRLMHEWLFG
ncbi:DUF2306 domain-containing protein [Paludibacterium paludis]|uniref:DUF2306 domain-containing protein n=1 Tax=Paludibacterium paludis TaxID=1225769 RepID=A0A918U7X1_9NEIS|nr:DUF2306 domain-containing protein [Paludibacterium paludis]GGY04910.1 hypothetical protein GCM10011289_04320 [Paludibacterium paludis]